MWMRLQRKEAGADAGAGTADTQRIMGDLVSLHEVD